MAAADVSTMTLDKPVSSGLLKKRRRRVPATGAAEDCHTCAKSGSTCDRRRPYCSQCLEIGKDCSGYRTTLTWGVGVASRGKLRGFSLPVPQSPTPKGPTSAPATMTVAPRPRSNTIDSRTAFAEDSGQQGRRKRVKLAPIHTNGRRRTTDGPLTASSVIPQTFSHSVSGITWQNAPYQPTRQDSNGDHQSYAYALRRDALFPLHTSIGGSFENVPWSHSGTTSIRSNSSSSTFPHTPDDGAFIDPFLSQSTSTPSLYPSSPGHSDLPFGWHPANDTQFEAGKPYHRLDLAPLAPLSAPSRKRGSIENQEAGPSGCFGPQVQSPCGTTFGEHVMKEEPVDSRLDATAADTMQQHAQLAYDLKLFSVPPRMSYLLDYYSQAICPVLVAWDGPGNPYRKHILQLATQSPGLQNAIGALTTNNIRMRTLKETPLLGQNSHSNSEIASTPRGAPSAEEQHYKSMSIEFLNAQLADPDKAKDDSVLATLLILCLFHVCDSGFSKFKTQLAGVQKLLKLRGGFQQSEFSGWVEMFFAWFDVMTSAVNDRETHLQGGSLDLTDVSSDLGEVEQFSGCDGRLFKLIARLGRLNLLSQSRPVRKLSDPEIAPASSTPIADTKSSSPKDFYSLPDSFLDPAQWDGFADHALPQQEPSRPEQQDTRHEFWQEWQVLRERLQAWQMDESPDLNALPVGQRDMLHISECFRWSALLYTERLAHPTVPSSSVNLQHLVGQALHHISEISVNSCVTKFMLWPLFITGTECVDETHRNMIRVRCVEIQKESGFYNNASGLKVLERVWRESDEESSTSHDSTTAASGCGVQAFRWRNCMDRVGGEYIVI